VEGRGKLNSAWLPPAGKKRGKGQSSCAGDDFAGRKGGEWVGHRHPQKLDAGLVLGMLRGRKK